MMTRLHSFGWSAAVAAAFSLAGCNGQPAGETGDVGDTPPDTVRRRLAEVQGRPGKEELTEALRTQLATLDRMQRQLNRFGDEMERILVEMDTIRGHIVSVGATTGAAAGKELAGEVRSLREQMGAVAEGMSAAYEDAT